MSGRPPADTLACSCDWVSLRFLPLSLSPDTLPPFVGPADHMFSARLTRRLAPPALAALLVAPAFAQDDPPPADDRDERIAELEAQVANLGAAYDEVLKILEEMRAAQAPDPADFGDEFYIPRQAAEFEQTQGFSPYLGNIYTKPFLSGFGDDTYIGGYIDVEFSDASSGASREFDQHRFVPFIYSDISDTVKLAAEVELEHGHEVEVEFAQLDFLFNDHANLRAGIQLLPLGKLNEVHDSPIQDLTFRPLVDTYIIPTTLRDAGLGLWGDITDELSYAATVTNGFRGLANDGTNAITSSAGLRNAAPQKDTIGDPFENIDNNLAYTGRLSWKPFLGVEAGVSALFDTYDEGADNHLEIFALDATINGQAVPFLPDNMELLYEGAQADIDRDAFALVNGVAGDMHGHYVQTNVHFAPDFLEDCAEDGGFVEDGSHFTFVTRYGMVDLDDYVMRRTTLGLNFRPNESNTVIKLDYLMNDDTGVNKGTNDANIWALSFASYF